MLTVSIFAVLAALGASSAMPTSNHIYKRADSGPTDTQVLQYALTLENLESTFYKGALAKFDKKAFSDAGYPDSVRGRYEQISTHETEHVALLSGALGNASVAPCNYSFPYTDVTSFINLATVVENVGVSAYSGAAQYIAGSETYPTVAAVILSTEARHQTWMSSSVLGRQPWSSAYDTPLSLDMVYTLVTPYITSCPDSNAALPVKAFPALTIGDATPGNTTKISWKSSNSSSTSDYAIFYSGLGSQVVKINDGKVKVPAALQGIYYVVVANTSTIADVNSTTIVAGPAILINNFGAWSNNTAFMPTGM